METYQLDHDITVFYVQAASFPEGIQQAFHDLDARIGNNQGRVYFGLSHGSPEGVVYKAAVQETFPGEGRDLGCDSFTIRKGTYRCEDLNHWRDNVQQMTGIFERLLDDPKLDTSSPCVEWYDDDNGSVRCMVRVLN